MVELPSKISNFQHRFETSERAIYDNFQDFFKVVFELFRYCLGINFGLKARFVDVFSAQKVDKWSLESKSGIKFWPSDIFHHFIDPNRSSHLGSRWKPFKRTTRLPTVVYWWKMLLQQFYFCCYLMQEFWLKYIQFCIQFETHKTIPTYSIINKLRSSTSIFYHVSI